MVADTRAKGVPVAEQRVVIVGAGFSGTIQAVNLLRNSGPRAVLVERSPRPGRGVAYSALLDEHVLNVRASNMSAFHDDPDHFVRWAAARGIAAAGDFVSRRTYGDYLTELLQQGMAEAPGRLQLVHDEAVGLSAASGLALRLKSGRTLSADTLVLAVGNLPPHDLPAITAAGLAPGVYASNPWSPDIADSLEEGDDVLVIGTGLTMVDVVLFLAAKGFAGRMFVMSRRGLLPRAHLPHGPVPDRLAEKPGPLSSSLVREVRRAADGEWRATIDSLRPFTQAMWRSATDAQRRRFLTHLRPWWDVHRHRLAPPVAARITELREQGRLVPLAGKILAVEPDGRNARIRWRPRGSDALQTMRVRRIVNCTGPQGDLQRTGEPLLRDMLAQGLIRPDAHRLGVDVDRLGRVVSADGVARPDIYALGPITRGAFWEIVAVPDIRVQSWALARRLSDSYWVEGEGL